MLFVCADHFRRRNSFRICFLHSACVCLFVCLCVSFFFFAVGSLSFSFSFSLCRLHICLFVHFFTLAFCPVLSYTCIYLLLCIYFVCSSFCFCSQRSNLLKTISFLCDQLLSARRISIFFASFFLRLLSFRAFEYTHIYTYVWDIVWHDVKREQQK